MLSPRLTTLSALAPLAILASSTYGRTTTNLTIFSPATLVPFLHMSLDINYPVNVTTINGITNRAANVGGNVTGTFNADILPLGAAFEILPPASNGVHAFYSNQWTLNTTSGQTILMDGRANIQYGNEALHGFGTVNFQTDAPDYLDLNWRSFVVEFEAFFRQGHAELDIFELKTAGKRDGSPTQALLPPGGA